MQTDNDIQQRDAKYRMMTEAPVRRLVLKMAVPTVISMMVTAIYNVADAAFVGHLSTEATAAVGISFAYMTFIQAIGFFFGHGSGNFIARALGAKNGAHAERMAATGFFSAVILGTAAAVLGCIFLHPLCRLLGATPEIEADANRYLVYILAATPIMMSCLVMNNQLRLQGSAQYAMIGLVSGAVLNIFLDPLFIFVFGWGVSGAAAATFCSQFFSWLLLMHGIRRAGNVHIRFRNFTPTGYYYKEIARGGLPSLCRQGLICLSTVCLNRAAAVYAAPGCEASTIAAFAVVSRIMMFAFSVILGIGQGFQPVCGFNYGAGKFGRVREALLFCMSLSTLLLLIMAAAGFLFSPQLIAFFRKEDPELIAVGVKVLRWQCAVFPLIGVTTATNMYFQTTGQVFRATLLSVCRQGLFFLPVLFVVPLFFGLPGLMATQGIADLLTFIFTLPFALSAARNLQRKADTTAA
ncbi:MAG: MATE family efflux transporter [Bacteroidales bacterium]|nr:MATE family efflux transporter [Bacteroidales bacterium]MBR4511503.1 MATE family efflux transporter [Bacteroidales bacterium]